MGRAAEDLNPYFLATGSQTLYSGVSTSLKICGIPSLIALPVGPFP